MKILHLLYESRGDYFGIGGVGARAYEIYGRLKERHDILLLCKRYPGARDGLIEGLRHSFAGTESRSLTPTFLSYAWEASRFVRQQGARFDVIVEEFSPAIPTILHRYRQRPVILQIQGFTGVRYFEKYNPLSSSVLYLLERFRPRGYDNLIIVSEETRRKYRLPPRARTELIENGVPDDLLIAEPSGADYILFLGRLDMHHKGLDILLNAYRKLSATMPGIPLVIAGDGRDRQAVEDAIQGLPADLRRNIVLPGWVSGKVKTDVLRAARFVVFPSRYEMQPIAALEAMACGKPVVVSSIPEFGFATACRGGISFRTEDADDLAAVMKQLWESDRLVEMGACGRGWVRTCTWDGVALRYEEFLRSVAAGSHGSESQSL